MDMQKIAHTLAETFVNSRMTFDDLSMKTDIPKSALHRYMTGETEKIPLDRFEAICNALNLDAASVLGWNPMSFDHTGHYLNNTYFSPTMVEIEKTEETIPEENEHEEDKRQVNCHDKARIYQALGVLAKADKEAAVSMFAALIDQGVL